MALRFEELIERHHDEIFAYVWRLLAGDRSGDRKTDADDLVQEVYLRAYRNFSRLRLKPITELGSTRSPPTAPTAGCGKFKTDVESSPRWRAWRRRSEAPATFRHPTDRSLDGCAF
jgi:hypothetical protein